MATGAGVLAVPLSAGRHGSFVWVFAMFVVLLVVLAVFVVRFAIRLGRERRTMSTGRSRVAVAPAGQRSRAGGSALRPPVRRTPEHGRPDRAGDASPPKGGRRPEA